METKKIAHELSTDHQEEVLKTFTKSKKQLERDSYRSYITNIRAHKQIMTNYYGNNCRGDLKDEIFKTLNPANRNQNGSADKSA
jgi:hypothetical protein